MADEPRYPFDRVVKELSHLTQRLDALGRVTVLCTLVHVALAFLSVVFALTRGGFGMRAFNSSEIGVFLLALDLSALVVSVMFLARFERFAKRGEVYFTEIANEKNWMGDDDDRLRFEYRVVLREFSLSSDLPLARGKTGVSLYLLLNGVATLVIWGMVLVALRNNYLV